MFIRVLDHELIHAIFAKLMGNKILELKVTSGMGGHLSHYGASNNSLINIAPYVFRLPVIFFVIWAFFEKQYLSIRGLEIYYYVVGLIIGYQIVCLVEEVRPMQSDIKQTGYIKGYLMIVSLNVIWLTYVTKILFQ